MLNAPVSQAALPGWSSAAALPAPPAQLTLPAGNGKPALLLRNGESRDPAAPVTVPSQGRWINVNGTRIHVDN
jgi:hypothetical protein